MLTRSTDVGTKYYHFIWAFFFRHHVSFKFWTYELNVEFLPLYKLSKWYCLLNEYFIESCYYFVHIECRDTATSTTNYIQSQVPLHVFLYEPIDQCRWIRNVHDGFIAFVYLPLTVDLSWCIVVKQIGISKNKFQIYVIGRAKQTAGRKAK